MIDFKPVSPAPTSLSTVGGRRFPRRTALVLSVAILAGGVGFAELAGGHQNTPAGASVASAAAAPEVSVAVVDERTLPAWSDFSGRIEAVGRVSLRPRVAGLILAVNFREGALVKKGDLLVTIDPAPFAAEVQRLQAQVTSAEAQVTLAAKEQFRGQQLVPSGTMAQRDLDQRVDNYRSAAANLRAAQAALVAGQLNLDYTQVRAPISGRVGKIEVTPGNLVDSGTNAPVLTTLVSVNPIYASFEVDEGTVGKMLDSLSGGAPSPTADLDTQAGRIPVLMGTLADDGTPFRGKLQLVDNVVATDTGTVRLRAVFDNTDGRLIPGQFARLRLGEAVDRPVIAISERAIGTDQDRRFVLVVDKQNLVAYREVALGGMSDGLRIVTSGLRPGERIVVNGLQRIRPGARVAAQTVEMASLGQASVASN